MTIFYPDISSYEAGISLAGMPAVVVKATEGTTYTNPDYARVAADAIARGIPWAAYHFLHHNSDPAAQARHFHSVAGNAPCMLDIETAGDGTRATLSDALTFSSALNSLGGAVRLAYFPHWYWQALGSPDLTPLTRAGIGLVSSNYTSYSNTGAGWSAYGGVTPTVWQYTDAHQLNGYTVDCNAFRGTVDQFRALLTGKAPNVTSPTDPILVHAASADDWGLDLVTMTDPAKFVGADGAEHTTPNLLVQAIKAIQAQGQANGAGISALTTQVTQGASVTLTDAQLATFATSVAAQLDYAKLGAAIVSHFAISQ